MSGRGRYKPYSQVMAYRDREKYKYAELSQEDSRLLVLIVADWMGQRQRVPFWLYAPNWVEKNLFDGDGSAILELWPMKSYEQNYIDHKNKQENKNHVWQTMNRMEREKLKYMDFGDQIYQVRTMIGHWLRIYKQVPFQRYASDWADAEKIWNVSKLRFAWPLTTKRMIADNCSGWGTALSLPVSRGDDSSEKAIWRNGD